MRRIGWITPFVAVVMLAVASEAFASWQDRGANPVFSPSGGAYYPSVLYDAANFSGHGAAYPYKMWYTDHSVPGYQIGLAGSYDGLAWTILADPIVGLSLPHHVQVLYDSGGFGGSGYCYRIWYWCQSGDLYSIASLHTAQSADGVTWVNDQALTQVGATVIAGTCHVNPCPWNSGSYGPIAMIYNAGGSGTLDDTNVFNNKYVMYYDGTTGSQETWGLAYSVDGLLWQGYNGGAAPVLPAGGAGAWDENYTAHGSVVHNASGAWDAWYGGGVSGSSEGIGHATSLNGLAWTRDPANPLTDLGCASPPSGLGCAGTWNAARNYTPVVLAWPFGSACPTQSLKMWRSGKSAASGDASYTVGYAEMLLPPPTVRNVPADYTTIQSAIDASNPGDTVQVAAGAYPEKLMITKPLTVRSTSGAASTIVHGPSGEPYVVFITATCVTLDGFTITSPDYADSSDASGVVVEPTQPAAQIRITNNIIHDIGTPTRPTVTFGNVGINVGMADGVEIDHNQIYNIIHNCPTAWANGICIWGNDESHKASNINIHDNAISNISSPYPINACVSMQDYVDNVTVFHNSLLSAENYGAEVRGSHTTGMQASCNWWGSMSGPTYPGNPGGTGSAITDNVTFSPWNDTDMTGTCYQATATQLAFLVQPGSSVINAALVGPPTVEIRDAGGNRVTRYTGPVTMAIGTNPSGGTLSGTNPVAAVAGRATFSDLSIDNAGVGYTLIAASPALTSATSTPFDVLCINPSFVSAVPTPDIQGADAQQILTLTNPAGSAMPSSFAFTWASAFIVRDFGTVSPGVPLGFWQEMRPYGTPFIPTGFYPVTWTGQFSAYVDVNGNGSYDPATDYLVVLSGHTITVTRTVSPGAVEGQDAGYRLILQSTLIQNPAAWGDYAVSATLSSGCPGPWSGSMAESIVPSSAGCPPGDLHDVGNTIRLTKSGASFTILWTADPSPAVCLVGYGVYASSDCKTWAAFGPLATVDKSTTQVVAGTGLNLTFYLVAENGPAGQMGPLGHYNQ